MIRIASSAVQREAHEVGGDDDPPPRQAVSPHASEEQQQHERRGVGGEHDADVGRVPRALRDVEREHDDDHAVADRADQLAEPQAPEGHLFPQYAHRPNYAARALRLSSAIRSTAWAVVAIGVAAPLVRRRLRVPPGAVIGAAAAVPAALCVAVPRSRKRDALVCCAQMWAYVAAYKMPNDDPEALERRVRVDYPVRVDRALGARRACRRCASSARSAPRRLQRPEKRARVGALGLVPGPARHGRLPAGRPPRALPARRAAHLRGLRHRLHRLLGAADRAALVRGRARARGNGDLPACGA